MSPVPYAVLADLAPELRSARDDGDLGGAQANAARLAAAWTESFANRPLVLVIDDLQWADESSLELLDFVVSSNTRVGLLGAYRHDELLPAVRRRLGSLVPRGEHLLVDGLDTGVGQVTAMLAVIRSLDGTVGSYGASGSDGAVPLS